MSLLLVSSRMKWLNKILPLLIMTVIVANLLPLALTSAASNNSEEKYTEFIPLEVDEAYIKEVAGHLASLGTRVTGYPGYYKAVDYVVKLLKSYGYSVKLQEFSVAVPVDKGVEIKIIETGDVLKGYSLYPNLVAVGGVQGLRGKVIYVGKGRLKDFNGFDVKGRIVLMDFDSGENWVNALMLGASAVIFIDTYTITRSDALMKLSKAPLDFPRIWVDSRTGKILKEAAEKGLTLEITTTMTWRKVKAYNIIAVLNGTGSDEERSKVLMITAHLDSMSVVPCVAPGAEEAINVAYLLYMAKTLSESKVKPKYSVWFVIFSGHWQGLAGARYFVEKFFFNNPELGKSFKPYFTVNLDISSGCPKLIVCVGGFMYCHRHAGALSLYEEFSQHLSNWMLEFYKKYPEYYNAISSPEFGKITKNFVSMYSFSEDYVFQGYSRPFILDAEPISMSKALAVSVLSFKDLRPRELTPHDELGYVEWNNLRPQFAFTTFMINRLLSKLECVWSGDWDAIRPTRLEIDTMRGGFGFARMHVEVIEYDPTIPTLYKPVPNALVVIDKIDWYYNRFGSLSNTEYRTFAHIIEMTDENGKVTVVGLAPTEIFIGNVKVLAYKVDKRGRLIYVPDMGPNGLGKFAPYPARLSDGVTIKAVAFKAAALALPAIMLVDKPYDLIVLGIYENPISPIPYAHYVSPVKVGVSIFLSSQIMPESYAQLIDYEKNIALVFAPPHKSVQTIVEMTGLRRKVIVLLNRTKDNPEGYGYQLSDAGSLRVVTFPTYTYASELLSICVERYNKALQNGVRDATLEEKLNKALNYLKESEKALKEKEYDKHVFYAYQAWSLAVEVYEKLRSMYSDFTNAVIALLVLIAPFSVIFEKLAKSGEGLRRVGGVIAAAILTFAVFALLHPSFGIVYNVPALALGVLMLVLATPSAFFLFLDFSGSLKEVRRRKIGAHFLEREKFELLVAAMSIGVENMRKRPLRTMLTLLTIILVVTSLVSLTSVIPVSVLVEMKYPSPCKFTAILIETPYNEPLDAKIIPMLQSFVGNKGTISPRYWLYPEGEEFILTTEDGKPLLFKAIVGLTKQELETIFSPMKELAELSEGFGESPYTCLIPKTKAEALGIEPGDIILFNGYKLRVTGIFDDTVAGVQVADICESPSASYSGPRPYDIEQLLEKRMFSRDPDFRLSWSDLLIVDARLLSQMRGAFIPSIEISFNKDVSEQEVREVAYKIYETFRGLDIYVVKDGKGFLLSSRYVQEFFGFSFMIVPVIIAGLVLTMTILGNLQERTKEMSIYSSLGLAPTHVAGMFLAENIAYAITGSVIGYVVGIIMARVFNFAVATGGMIGMNYSSASVLVSLGLVMGLVVAASLYPFFKIAKLVTPSLERKWRIPTKPRGDIWEVPLPFTFRSYKMVAGLSLFIKEYFDSMRAERAGLFTVLDTGVEIDAEATKVYAKVWLAPFELNIQQDVTLVFKKSVTEGKYFTLLIAKRLSGPYDSWVTSNENFIRALRKQLLTWRLLTPEERNKYIKQALSLKKGGE